MPLEMFASTVAQRLFPLGFRALDERDGSFGGNRHGTWDLTWIRARLGSGTCFVSALTDFDDGGAFDLHVHAGASVGLATGQTLVAAFRGNDDYSSRAPWAEEAADAMVEAAKRALNFPLALLTRQALTAPGSPEEVSREEVAEAIAGYLLSGPKFPPYTLLLDDVVGVIEEATEVPLSNMQVLAALIRRGVRADRAGVNAALADLAGRGVITRVRRGLYRAREER